MGDPITYGWAVLTPTDGGWYNPGAPLVSSIAGTRDEVMKNFVSRWRTMDHDDWPASKVWQMAYRRGWRLSRVAVTPALGYRS